MAYTITPAVPYIPQVTKKECWYVAYKMIVAHRFGESAAFLLPEKIERMHARSAYNSGMGLPVDEFSEFAESAGLVSPLSNTRAESVVVNTIPMQRTIGGYSSVQLEILLRNHGPLWISWKIFKGGHIIVLVGVDNQTVYYHDPQAGANCSQSLLQFNRNLNPLSANHQIMYMPNEAKTGTPDIGSAPPIVGKSGLSLNDRISGVALP